MLCVNVIGAMAAWIFAFEYADEHPRRVQFGFVRATCSDACAHWNIGEPHDAYEYYHPGGVRPDNCHCPYCFTDADAAAWDEEWRNAT